MMKAISKTTTSWVNDISFKEDYLKVLLVGIAYFFAHGLAFFYPDSEKVVMLIWPAGGISLVAFLLNPKRLWPALTIAFYISGVTASVFLIDRSIVTSFGFMTGNMVESIGCAWLILLWSKDFQKFSTIKEVLALIIGAVFINAIGACIGAGTSVLTSGTKFAVAWRSWYISDGLGILLVAPFVVSWIGNLKHSLSLIHSRSMLEMEGIVCILILMFTTYLIFYKVELSVSFGFHTYILVALIAWPAIRFGQIGVTLILMMSFLFALFSPSIVYGPSPFPIIQNVQTNRLLELQFFFAFLAIVGYIISVGYSSLLFTQKKLREKQDSLIKAQKFAHIGSWTWNIKTNQLEWSDEMYYLFGISRETFAGSLPDVISRAIHPDDRLKVDESNLSVINHGKSVPLEYRIVWPDKSIHTVWAEAGELIFDESGNPSLLSGIVQDITERKEAETALQNKERYQRALLDNFPFAVWLKDTESRFLAVNKTFADTFRKQTTEELVGKTDFDITEHNTAESYRAHDLDVMVSRTKQINEGEVIGLGERNWSETYRAPVIDENGDLLGTVGFLRDISERKMYEDSLKIYSDRFTALIQTTKDGFWIADLDGKILEVNDSYCNMIGYSKKQLLKMKIQDVEYLETDKDILKHYEQITESGWQRFESKHQCEDGKIIDVEISMTYLQEKNTIIAFINNTTGRKLLEARLRENEERFRLLFEQAPLGYQSLDEDGSFIVVNQAWLDILGYKKDEVIGKWFGDFLAPTYRDAFRERFPLFKAAGKIHSEFEMVHKDGTQHYIAFEGRIGYKTNGEFKQTHCILADITEQRKQELMLKESEKRFRELFDYTPIAYQSLDESGIFIDVNKDWLNLMGYSLNEVRGKSFAAFWSPETRDKFKERFNHFKEHGIINDAEVTLVSKNGDCLTVILTGKIQYDTEGNIVKTHCIIVDITQRKRLELILQESETQQRLILNNINELVYFIKQVSPDSPEGIPTFISDRSEMLIGLKPIEFKENPYLWYSLIHPEDQSIVNKQTQEIFTHKNPGVRLYRILNKLTGKFIWIEDYVVPELNDLDQVIGTFGVARDITERKEMEEELVKNDNLIRTAVDNLPIIYYHIDSKGLFQLSIGAGLKGLGLKPNQVVGLSVFEIYKDFPVILTSVEKALSGEHAYFESTVNGSSFDNYLAPIFNKTGKLFGIVGVAVDISEHKHAESELQKYRNHLEELVKLRTEALNIANDELTKKVEREEELKLILQESLEKEKELNELKSRFISTTSHEFRTPLTSILSSTGLLQRYSNKWSEDKKNEHFDRIGNSVTYLVKLLDDILTISHADSGKIIYEPELIDLKQLVKECVIDSQNLSAFHHIKLTFKPTQKDYLLDQKLMRFILNNLLSNAIKYSPKAKDVDLSISTKNNNLMIEVSDYGIGIPMQETQNIFQSFYRTKNVGEIRGTGLGLAIVKRAVDLHGGEITVSSELNIRTTFTVIIPIR